MYDIHLAVIDIISQGFFNLVSPIIQSCSSTSSFEFSTYFKDLLATPDNLLAVPCSTIIGF